MKKILIVEDEIDIREGISEYLSEVGYDVMVAEDGQEGIDLFKSNEFDLVLLDIMLPKINGFGVLSQIREISDVPVMMLTAMTDDYSQIMSFNEKADDYITKPFDLLELIARVKSNLRRYVTLGNYDNNFNKDILKSGGLELNISTKEVKVDGEVVKITPIEFKILKLLLSNKGRVFSIDEIYEKVWNEESFNVENTVAVHIRRIREKIEINPKEPRYLKVVWGVGYKIEKL